MDHRSKCQIQYYRTFRRNRGEPFCDLTLIKEFLNMTPKAQFLKGKGDKGTSPEFKTLKKKSTHNCPKKEKTSDRL